MAEPVQPKRNIIRYKLRGDARVLFSAPEHEVILAGPADTGKTVASILKAHAICSRVPNAQGAIIRKTQSSLSGSVVKTFQRITAGSGVRSYGGETPSKFIYPNGSVVWLGGMDNPDKVLSSERDFIYVNQAEELTLNDWETLATRCSGRASVIEHPQLYGDCNPGGSKHWIRERAASGKLRLLNARHQDNPTIYDDDGKLTPDGEKRLSVLQNLSGVRRKRLLEGIWATSEGAVYDTFDPSIHICTRLRSEMRRNYLAVDEGYTNPAVILDIGEDNDGRWHCFREFYKRGVLQGAVVTEAKLMFQENGCELAAVDESAAGLIADMVAAGIRAIGGKGRVLDGINHIQNRLKVAGDGRPRYTIDPSCVNHINEFESYVWKPEKDVPEKEYDHSLDAVRYLDHVLVVPTGAWDTSLLPPVAAPDPDAETESTDMGKFEIDFTT
jgi:phage terminase large subunit